MRSTFGILASYFRKFKARLSRGLSFPIATKLSLSFLVIIIIISVVFSVVGIQLISNRIVAEAQEMVNLDLNSARGIYQDKLDHINDVVQLTAAGVILAQGMTAGNVVEAADELIRVKETEGLDVLDVTDAYGDVLLRTSNLGVHGDSQIHNELVSMVIIDKAPVAATIIVSGEDLNKDAPLLAQQADIKFINTPMARLHRRDRANQWDDAGSGGPDL